MGQASRDVRLVLVARVGGQDDGDVRQNHWLDRAGSGIEADAACASRLERARARAIVDPTQFRMSGMVGRRFAA